MYECAKQIAETNEEDDIAAQVCAHNSLRSVIAERVRFVKRRLGVTIKAQRDECPLSCSCSLQKYADAIERLQERQSQLDRP